jgi:hypothetical protein
LAIIGVNVREDLPFRVDRIGGGVDEVCADVRQIEGVAALGAERDAGLFCDPRDFVLESMNLGV